MNRLTCLRFALFSTVIIIGALWGQTSANAQSMVGLGFLPGDTGSQALGVSADGTVVVGSRLRALVNRLMFL